MEYFWFAEHFVITIQHQLTCQMLLKNTQLLQFLVLSFTRATFLLGFLWFCFFFFLCLKIQRLFSTFLNKIYCSKWQKLIPSKIYVTLPEQENSWMKPVGTGISVQGNLSPVCQQWPTAKDNCDFIFFPVRGGGFYQFLNAEVQGGLCQGLCSVYHTPANFTHSLSSPLNPLARVWPRHSFYGADVPLTERQAVFNQGHKRWTSHGCLW